jgi:hypothetical protein
MKDYLNPVDCSLLSVMEWTAPKAVGVPVVGTFEVVRRIAINRLATLHGKLGLSDV